MKQNNSDILESALEPLPQIHPARIFAEELKKQIKQTLLEDKTDDSRKQLAEVVNHAVHDIQNINQGKPNSTCLAYGNQLLQENRYQNIAKCLIGIGAITIISGAIVLGLAIAGPLALPLAIGAIKISFTLIGAVSVE